MATFEYFKANVTIMQVAESLGYKWNRDAGKNPVEYKHPDLPTIVIKNPTIPERQVYFTRHDSLDRGSVIDFVKNRLDKFSEYYDTQTEGINKVLSRFAQIPYKPAAAFEHQSEIKDQFRISDYLVKPSSASNLDYLKSRGLDAETLSVFSPYIDIVDNKKLAKNFDNIGFPYRIPGKDDIVGYELRNFSFRGHAAGSDKTNGVWAAGGNSIKDLYFGESAIDLMSFYQLKKNSLDFNRSAFISVGGGFGEKQITNTLEFYKPEKVHSVFDNDLTGNLYDVKLLALKNGFKMDIRIKEESVTFTMGTQMLQLSKGEANLHNVAQGFGIKNDLTLHKSEGKDWNESLQQNTKFKNGY